MQTTNQFVVPFSVKEARSDEFSYDQIHAWCYKYIDITKREYTENAPVEYVDDIKHTQSYITGWNRIMSSAHIGQLKLGLSELSFLQQYCGGDGPVYMIYAGSAPNEHFYMLRRHFTNVKFIFFDPNEHLALYPDNKTHYDHPDDVLYYRIAPTNRYNANYERTINVVDGATIRRIDRNTEFDRSTDLRHIKETGHRLYIFETYFNNEWATRLAAALAGERVLFCSDIRTSANTEEIPGDSDVIWNNAQQLIWYRILKPAAAMFKFRPLFFVEHERHLSSLEHRYADTMQHAKAAGVDFVEAYKNRKLVYLEGRIMLQAFAGEKSSEVRLMIDGPDAKIIEYDNKDFDNRMYYYNIFIRNDRIVPASGLDKLTVGERAEFDRLATALGYDHCCDCANVLTVYQRVLAGDTVANATGTATTVTSSAVNATSTPLASPLANPLTALKELSMDMKAMRRTLYKAVHGYADRLIAGGRDVYSKQRLCLMKYVRASTIKIEPDKRILQCFADHGYRADVFWFYNIADSVKMLSAYHADDEYIRYLVHIAREQPTVPAGHFARPNVFTVESNMVVITAHSTLFHMIWELCRKNKNRVIKCMILDDGLADVLLMTERTWTKHSDHYLSNPTQ